MYIFTRYVVAEVLKFFLITLTGLTLIVTVVMGVKEGLSRGLPPSVMLYTMPYLIPEMMCITIPVSLLLAVSIVYGRMTGTNEVLALKSLGVNPMAIIWPAIVFAFLLSLGTIWLQEIAATWCRPRVTQVAAESIEEIAYGMLRTNNSCKLAQFSITVKRVTDDNKLIQPTITLPVSGSDSITTLRAAEAELRTDRQKKGLNIICRDVIIDLEEKVQYTQSDEQVIFVPMMDPGKPEHHRDWVALYEIPEHIAQLKMEIWPLEERRAAVEARGLQLAETDRVRLADLWHMLYRLQTEPYRRFSNGFTCLCFVLIGIPVSMFWRHADILTNFFVCFVPVLAVYYPLLMLSEDLSTSGKLWPISFWLSNTVFIAAGIYLLKRVVNH
jgi:lipopolysaccharide export system permease protein